MTAIPDEAVEAAKEAVWNTDAPEYKRDYLMHDNIMRAALSAALPLLPREGVAEAPEPRDPWPKAGDKMRFLNRNGYEGERERAAKVFAMDRDYTVKSISIGSWSSSIYFEEVEFGWNSVMFAPTLRTGGNNER